MNSRLRALGQYSRRKTRDLADAELIPRLHRYGDVLRRTENGSGGLKLLVRDSADGDRWFADSSLEEGGFELPVPVW
jgi:hypothetical protein